MVYHDIGPPSFECPNCKALMWYEERCPRDKSTRNPMFSICCQRGKVLLPKFNEAPSPLNKLIDYNNPASSRFKEQIRVYNGMFCYTSFGAKIDNSVNTGRGPYTFRINGQSYHRIGSLLPARETQPKYAQLYFFDTANEVKNRMGAFIDKESAEVVDEKIVASLIKMFDQSSSIAKAFRMARDWCDSQNSPKFELRLLSHRSSTRQYNAPTVPEIAALITNDFGDGIPTRDIIISNKDEGLKRISELHPEYMALQYPLLFPYGEDGFHEKIQYHNNRGDHKTKRDYVTMKEFYAYVIQQRNNQGTTLLRGGRLFQQYLVDAFTSV